MSCGIVNYSNRRFGVQNAVKGMVSSSKMVCWKKEIKSKRGKMRAFPEESRNSLTREMGSRPREFMAFSFL